MKLDNKGRIIISKDFRDFLEIKENQQLYIYFEDFSCFSIGKEYLKDRKVLYLTKMDNQGRIQLSKEVLFVLGMEEDTKIYSYVFEDRIFVSKL